MRDPFSFADMMKLPIDCHTFPEGSRNWFDRKMQIYMVMGGVAIFENSTRADQDATNFVMRFLDEHYPHDSVFARRVRFWLDMSNTRAISAVRVFSTAFSDRQYSKAIAHAPAICRAIADHCIGRPHGAVRKFLTCPYCGEQFKQQHSRQETCGRDKCRKASSRDK